MGLTSRELINQSLDARLRHSRGAAQAESWRVLDYRVEEDRVYGNCQCSATWERKFVFDLEYTTKRGRVGKATIRLSEMDMEEIVEQFVREVVMS